LTIAVRLVGSLITAGYAVSETRRAPNGQEPVRRVRCRSCGSPSGPPAI